jgi:hypothetical protein
MAGQILLFISSYGTKQACREGPQVSLKLQFVPNTSVRRGRDRRRMGERGVGGGVAMGRVREEGGLAPASLPPTPQVDVLTPVVLSANPRCDSLLTPVVSLLLPL